jgi:hypothetical protein
MSRSSRPISLRSAMVIRRAQAQIEARRSATASQSPVRTRSASAFSFSSLFGSKSSMAANDLEEVERMQRVA